MKTIIADGNNLGWMAVGIAPLTYEGKRVEAIYVGLNMIRSYLQRFEPDGFYLAWDGGRDPERLRLYPDYKKRRGELTEVEKRERNMFFDQLNKLQEVMKSLGVVQFRCEKREADDIIFNLLSENEESIIVSTDKDFYQLLERENVSVYNPVTKQVIKAEDVEKKYDIPIDYFIDYKALVGDPSDNLPGVKGIGEKWAKWIVADIMAAGEEKLVVEIASLDNSKRRIMGLFDDNLGTFDLMRKLIRLRKIGEEEMRKGMIEDRPKTLAELQERGIAICEQYGFEKHLNSFPSFIQPFEMLWERTK